MLYYKNIKSSLDKNNPDIKITEKVKLASMKYKDLSPEEKQKLNAQSEKLLEEYREKMEKWRSSLSSEEKDALKAEHREQREKKEKRKIAKLQRQNEMPRRQGTSFSMYVSDQLKAINLQFMSPTERLEAVRRNMSECSQRWKAMPEAEKEIYNKRAAEEQELHEAEMLQWEQNMIEEGKEKLIRKKTLKKHQTEVRKADKEAAKATASSNKTVSKKSGVKSTKALETKAGKSAPKKQSAPRKQSTPKKHVHFEESGTLGKKDFYSSDSE
ncbi:transcription factor A, mitochondrial-like isoform X2 [Mercenaria mercenaria]|nr:transcription factor A, mitochondrial-like isoform X2 [Mercenaria mercenaria]XP_053392660.1 transcription factor A, mitochondrial-like isoform X2 [Mercenaria mercenaria]